MSELHCCDFASPLGPLRLVASEEALVAVRLPGEDTLRDPPSVPPASHPVLAAASCELAEYFAGERRSFTVPIAPTGSAFQRTVWNGLTTIPFGQVRSYGWLARAIGKPSASRAVGAANGRNPLAIVVPCHRVIGADGSLTGYAGGLEIKRWLLRHEAAAGGQGEVGSMLRAERRMPHRRSFARKPLAA